jgi:hypothetical protein
VPQVSEQSEAATVSPDRPLYPHEETLAPHQIASSFDDRADGDRQRFAARSSRAPLEPLRRQRVEVCDYFLKMQDVSIFMMHVEQIDFVGKKAAVEAALLDQHHM